MNNHQIELKKWCLEKAWEVTLDNKIVIDRHGGENLFDKEFWKLVRERADDLYNWLKAEGKK